MSARTKKFVGKGAIVAMFAVVAVVGVVIAQRSMPTPGWNYSEPEAEVTGGTYYATGSNAAVGLGKTTAELSVGVEVDNFAYLFAYQAAADAAKLDTLKTINPASDPDEAGDNFVGNIGFIIAETNFSAWDILVKARNGGFLVRDPDPVRYTNETETSGDAAAGGVQGDYLDEIADYVTKADGEYDLGVGKPDEHVREFCATTSVYEVTPAIPAVPGGPGGGGSPGIPAVTVTTCSEWMRKDPAPIVGYYLKQRNATPGGAPVAAPLKVAIGSFRLGNTILDLETNVAGLLNGGSLHTLVYAQSATGVVSFIPLKFDANKIASFATSFSDAFVLGASSAVTEAEIHNVGSPYARIGTAQTLAATDAGKFVLAGLTDTTDNTENDGANKFTYFGPISTIYNGASAISSGAFAGMGIGTDPPKKHPAMMFYVSGAFEDIEDRPLAGNRNGVYTETLEFTFWGVY